MERKNSGTSASVGFSGFLTIAFIVLKLMGVIEWSWIWVLSPLWIEAAIILVIVVVFYIIK